MDREQILALRRQARQEKNQVDQRRLELHRRIVQVLAKGDQESKDVLAQALGQIEKWERHQLCNPRYAVAWREWLKLPHDYARAAILREDDLGVSMRQNSPFNHAMASIA